MTAPKVLVVEDESIVAFDIQNRLMKLGYLVPAIASSGQEAIAKAAEIQPDLVLMDIKLKGELDGIETVRQLQAKFDLPVVYLTAFADDITLQRAKITAPNGYLLKPFVERELQTTIEMALYKHKLEKQLKESQQWLDTTLHSIDEAVIATDAAGRVKFMNPTAEQLTGWLERDALGQSISEVFEVVDEASGRLATGNLLDVLERGRAVNLTGQLLLAKNGLKIPIDQSAAPIIDSRRNIIGLVLTFQDMTAKRALQAQLVKQERLAAVGRLAGGIAHEFNNILTSIIGFAHLARAATGADTLISHDLDQVIEQGQRAAYLVQQMLDFSRKSMLQKRPLALAPFIRDTVKLLQHTIPDQIELTLAVDPACETIRVEADPALIQQILTNLVSNAIDAMLAEGVLTIRLFPFTGQPGESLPDQPDLTEAGPASRYTNWLAIAVADTGFGISPEHRSQLFEPFFSTKEVGRGTGLGLAQVYGIVKQHQGEIEIQSRVGQGTTVTVYLPVLAGSTPTQPAQPKASQIPRGHGETILVVEEASENGGITQVMLEYLGYQVLTANKPAVALELYQQQADQIAVVLVDILAPGLGGSDLIKTLFQQYPEIKLVAVTHYPPEAAPPIIPAAGTITWLSKPWTPPKLAQIMRQLLS